MTARKVVRFALFVGMGSQFFKVISAAYPIGASLRVPLAILGVLAGIIALVGEFAKFMYFEKLAARIPNQLIVKRARFLRWAFTITLGVVTVGGGLLALTMRTAGAGVPGFAYILIIAALALLVFSILTILLLFRLRRAIAEQARTARVVWDTAGRHARQAPESS